MLTFQDSNKTNLRYVYFSIIGALFVIKNYETIEPFSNTQKLCLKKITQTFTYFHSKSFVNIVKKLKSKSKYHFVI